MAASHESLSGRVALVTGGTSGIGFATAEALLDAGAAVVISGRDTARGEQALGLLRHRTSHANVAFHAADVTSEPDVVGLVDMVCAQFGGLHIAVNNAANTSAANETGPEFTDMTLEVFEAVVRSCLTSVWLCMKHELSALKSSGGGSIINISSLDALTAGAGTGSYAAAKAGVNALSRAAATEYAGQGIRINVVSPGAIETPMLARNLDGDNESERRARMNRYVSSIAAGRLGQPHEIADVIVWLASKRSSYVVGHNVVVDGLALGINTQ